MSTVHDRRDFVKTIASISRNDGTLNLIGPGLTRASSAKDDALRDEECAYSLLTSMGRRTVHRIGWHINRIGYRIVSRDGSLRRGRPELCIKRRTEHHLGHIWPQRHHETVSPGRTRNEPEIGSRSKPLAERRAKCLPLVDLPGLIRSFHKCRTCGTEHHIYAESQCRQLARARSVGRTVVSNRSHRVSQRIPDHRQASGVFSPVSGRVLSSIRRAHAR